MKTIVQVPMEKELLDRLDATHVATGSLINDRDPEDPEAPYERELVTEARRFEEGSRNYLGIAEETVCRVFTRFQEEGLLTTRRRYVELHDLDRLRAIAHDPGRRAAATAALTSVA